jgi:hypothetical protein
MKKPLALVLSLLAWNASMQAAPQAFGTVKSQQKISDTQGGFGGALSSVDNLGWSTATLGDLDGDGIGDLAVGAIGDDDGGAPFHESNRGAVWILFLNGDGTVKAEQKISDTQGGFGGVLHDGDFFGYSVAGLGDIDGDGVGDLAVGAPFDDDRGTDYGALWILFLHSDGTVKAEQKLTGIGTPGVENLIGYSLGGLGDLDGDGIGELAVGAPNSMAGGVNAGALWILFLDSSGNARAQQKIGAGQGGFGGALPNSGQFGSSVAAVGDLDGDGIEDLAVGSMADPDGGFRVGAVWILFLDANGTVKTQQKICNSAGGLVGHLDIWEEFGCSVAGLGDLDEDGVADLAVGARQDNDAGDERGAVWILFLHADGTVKAEQKINELVGGFGGALERYDYFACSLACLGDLDGDGVVDLATGAFGDDDGLGDNRGALYQLFLVGPDHLPPVITCPTSVTAVCSKDGSAGEIVTFSVSATDALDPAPSVVCVPSSGSLFPRGTTIVTCTATDASGNQSVSMFPVVVRPTVREHRL